MVVYKIDRLTRSLADFAKLVEVFDRNGVSFVSVTRSALPQAIQTCQLPKKVSWDQKKLKAIAERIAASGEAIESYLDVKFAVSESRYTNWPPELQQQFADARTVEAGKPAITLSRDLEV